MKAPGRLGTGAPLPALWQEPLQPRALNGEGSVRAPGRGTLRYGDRLARDRQLIAWLADTNAAIPTHELARCSGISRSVEVPQRFRELRTARAKALRLELARQRAELVPELLGRAHVDRDL